MTALYTELRKVCNKRGITQDDIAKCLGISRGGVSLKINGKSAWDQNEMYALLDMIHEPHRKMHLYFPPGGMWAGSAEDPPPGVEEQLLAAIKAYVHKEARA